MDEFEKWLAETFVAVEGGHVDFRRGIFAPRTITPEQARRLALRLLSLAGPPAGLLTDGELAAIRGRAEADREYWQRYPELKPSVEENDRAALLAHCDALAATLAHAEAEVAGIEHVVACLQNDKAAYQAGVEEGVRRCVETLRSEAKGYRVAGDTVVIAAENRGHTRADALDAAAAALEKEPA